MTNRSPWARAAVLATGWLIRRSRLGLALRVIGEDETVARHSGIDTARAKLTLFAASAMFMTLAGAIMAEGGMAERLVNLAVMPYLLSKFAFLAPVLVICVSLMTGLLWAAGRLPASAT